MNYPLRLTGSYPWYVVVPGALILAILAWRKYRREVSALSPPAGWLLPLLRAAVVFLLCMALLEPVVSQVAQRKKDPGKILVILDNSQSMSQTDPQAEASRRVQLLSYYGFLPPEMVNVEYARSADKLSEAIAILQMKVSPLLKNVGTYNPEDIAPDLRAAFEEALSLLKQALRLLQERRLWERAGEQKDEFASIKRRAEALDGQIEDLERQWRVLTLQNEKQVHAMVLKIEEACRQIDEFRNELLRMQENLSRNFLRGEDDQIQRAEQEFGEITRWERVQRILSEGASPLLTQLQRSFLLTCYTLTGPNKEIPLLDTREGEYSEASLALPPIADIFSTDLTEVVLRELGRGTAPDIHAVVLLSDGQHNSETNFALAAGQLSQFDIPLFPIGLGCSVYPRDVGVIGVTSPDAVEYKMLLRGEIGLKTDLEEGEEVFLKITQQDRVIWEKTVTANKKERIRRVEFDIDTKEKLEKEGGYVLRVVAEEREGEVIKENNQARFNVEVLPEKKSEEYELLLVDSSPRWELRYLNTLLERSPEYPRVSEKAFFTRRLLSSRFPQKREDLFKFNTLVFGDIPPEWLKDEQKEWIEEFVRIGGGIIFVDGKGRNIGKYSQGPLRNLIPIKRYLSEGEVGEREPTRRGEYTLKLTARGRETELFNFHPSPLENARLWNTVLAKLHALVKVEKYPDVELLVESDPEKFPVFLVRKYGAGKVFYSAVDETWRWRYKREDEYFEKFWKKLIKWMREKPYLTWDKYVFLDIDKFVYQVGEKVQVRVKVVDKNNYPLSGAKVNTVIYSTEGERKLAFPLEEKEDGTGRYVGSSVPLESGGYTLGIEVADLPEEEMKARINFTVESSEREEKKEFVNFNWDEERLQELARVTGGKYLREENSSEIMNYLPQETRTIEVRKDLPVWQSVWFFSFIALLLTLEWAIRKRHTLL